MNNQNTDSIDAFLAGFSDVPSDATANRVSQEIPEDVQNIIAELSDLSSADNATAASEVLSTSGELAEHIPPENGIPDQINTIPTHPLFDSADVIGDLQMTTVQVDTPENNEDNSFEWEEANPVETQNETVAEVYDQPNDNTSRFRGAPWFDIVTQQHITVIGLGGIGSYLTFLLSRLQPISLTLIDDDRVDASNLSGQMYGISNIDTLKTTSINRIIREFSNYYNASAVAERFTPEHNWLIKPITFCGLDNMEARRDCYNSWKSSIVNCSSITPALFIDGRLAMEEYQIFCITREDTERREIYERDWLFSSDEAENTVCSLKQTSFMATGIASMMVNLMVNYLCNWVLGANIRDVPFFTSYSAPCVFLKTE